MNLVRLDVFFYVESPMTLAFMSPVNIYTHHIATVNCYIIVSTKQLVHVDAAFGASDGGAPCREAVSGRQRSGGSDSVALCHRHQVFILLPTAEPLFQRSISVWLSQDM